MATHLRPKKARMLSQEEGDEDGSYKRVYATNTGGGAFVFTASSVAVPASSSIRDKCVLVAQSLGRRLSQSFPLVTAKSPSAGDKKRPRKATGTSLGAAGASPPASDASKGVAPRRTFAGVPRNRTSLVAIVYSMAAIDTPTAAASHWSGVGCIHTRKLRADARVLALEDPSSAERKAVLRLELQRLQEEAEARAGGRSAV